MPKAMLFGSFNMFLHVEQLLGPGCGATDFPFLAPRMELSIAEN